MRSAILCLGLVVLSASSAWGVVSGGPGGYIYYGINYDCATNSSPVRTELFRTTIDGNWNVITKAVNFDNIDMLPRGYTAHSNTNLSRGVEVWDPRQLGGNGDLVAPATVIPRNPPAASNEAYPWDIVRVDVDCAAGNNSFSVANGNILLVGYYDGNVWRAQATAGIYTAVRAPEGWAGKTTNGVALVLEKERYNKDLIYWYDANGNGYADNAAGDFTDTARDYVSYHYDLEFGLDGALYSSHQYGTPSGIWRYYPLATGTFAATLFAQSGGAGNPIGQKGQENSAGIAVGGTASRPIVYLIGKDNVSDGAGGFLYRESIFALVDGDGDNVADWANAADTVVKIWQDNQFGLSPGSDWIHDLEYYMNPENGTKFLLFNGGTGNHRALYVLELYDNGLLARDGKLIATGAAGWMFEIDMNYVAPIPEPATLLLLGAGAMGAFGVLRRRRMR